MPWANDENRKAAPGLTIAGISSACFFLILLISACNKPENKTETITREEWAFFEEPERSAVFAYFHGKYGAEDAPDFWRHDFNGERPQDMLRARARKNLTRIKIEETLARDEGLLKDIGWKAFLQDFKNENERRAGAIQAGQVVYGPTVMDMRAYFQYRHSNMVIHLKESLAGKGLKPAEADLLHAYDSLKTTLFSGEADPAHKGTVPYAEVRAIIRQKLLDAAYDRKIDSLASF